jgi:uncharacterized protein YaaW (UPF0174 family)
MSDIQETAKHGVDGVATFITVGALAEFLPPIAAIFTIVWTGLRVYIIIENRIKTGKWKD